MGDIAGLEADAALVESVVAGASFDAMKTAATAAESAGGRANSAYHLRKGGSGDWRNHFSHELEAAFRRRFDEAMRGTGLEYDLGLGETLKASPASGPEL